MEYARNVLHLEGAQSSEFAPDTPHPVVIEMPEHNSGDMGGTMRLGKRTTVFKTTDSLLSECRGWGSKQAF
jgi:CTP synthase